MLTRTCPRCEGNGLESGADPGQPCLGCKGGKVIEVFEDPIMVVLPSDNTEPMKMDPPIDPAKTVAGKRSVETCGECACCRHWKAKMGYVAEKQRAAVANAQKWASYWKQQYESLAAAKKKDS